LFVTQYHTVGARATALTCRLSAHPKLIVALP